MKHYLFCTISSILLLGITALSSCSDDETIYNDVTLVAGNSHSINGGSNWTSENPLIASVENTTVTAKRVGKTKIAGSDGSFNVTVTPQYNLYEDPCFNWGCSKSTIKNFMSAYTLGTETDDDLFYSISGTDLMCDYNFEDGKMESVTMLARSTKYASTIADFLAERYVALTVDTDNLRAGFISPDGEMIVVLMFTTLSGNSYAVIGYTKYSPSEANSLEWSTTKAMKSMKRVFGGNSNMTIDKELNTEIINRISQLGISNN